MEAGCCGHSHLESISRVHIKLICRWLCSGVLAGPQFRFARYCKLITRLPRRNIRPMRPGEGRPGGARPQAASFTVLSPFRHRRHARASRLAGWVIEHRLARMNLPFTAAVIKIPRPRPCSMMQTRFRGFLEDACRGLQIGRCIFGSIPAAFPCCRTPMRLHAERRELNPGSSCRDASFERIKADSNTPPRRRSSQKAPD